MKHTIKQGNQNYYNNSLRPEQEIVIDTGTFSYDALIGMQENEAVDYFKKNNIVYRVMARDETAYLGTCDVKPGRVNLAIKNNLIVGYHLG